MLLKILYAALLLFTLSSCINKKDNTELHYDFYKNGQLLKHDSICIKKSSINYSDTFKITLISKDSNQLVFKEYTDQFKGIFRSYGGSYFLNYPFSEKDFVYIDSSSHPPFINSIVQKKQSKIYRINNKNYEIISFSEYSPLGDIVSYYNIKIGFICYYIENDDSYLLVYDASGIKKETVDLQKLASSLIHDTSYFATFTSGLKNRKPFNPPG
jgi:hypothetical protein